MDFSLKNRIAFNTVVLALMALIGGAVYSNSLHNGYHYDDIHHIVGNQYITTLRNIPLFFSDTKTFSSDPQGRNHYRPLVLTSYALDYYFGKLKPEVYHLVNLAFHIGSAFLVFLIVQAMQGGGIRWGGVPFAAVAAGLLFLTTPFNSEVVNYISARSSVMCAFFYLLAFYCWVKYRKQSQETLHSTFRSATTSVVAYIASLFAFLLAMLTKEIAITLPVMIFLYDIYFRRERRDRPSGISFTPYVPFVMVAGVTGVLFRMIFCGNFLSPGIGASRGFGTQLFTELRLLVKYTYMTLVPVGLSVEHPVGLSTSLWEFRVLISMIVLLSIGGTLFFLWRSKDIRYRIISFFGAWFFVTLLPTTVIPLNAMFQENRGYLPGVGIMAIVGVIWGGGKGVGRFAYNDIAKIALLSLIVLVYGFMTYNRNMVWKDDITLWKDVQEKYPLSRNVPLELGRLYMADDPDLAEQEFKKILQRDPQDAAALNNLGNLYFNKGEFRLAEEMYLKAIEINPGEYKFHFNLARVYKERGDREQAAEEYREVLRLAPYFTPAAELLAGLYAEMGKGEVIEGAFQSASQNDPGNPAYHKGLGIAYAKQQKWDKAAEAFEKALEITPDDVQTRVVLGDSYMKMGEPDMAEREFRRALELEPGNGMANQGLGILYQQQEEYDLAIRHYERAIEGRIGSPKVLNNMGTIYLRTGKAGKAIETFKEALRLDPSYHMARINLGRAYESVKRYREAKEEYLKVIQGGNGRKVSDDMYREAKKRLEGLK